MNAMVRPASDEAIPTLCAACSARHKGMCGALTPVQLGSLQRQTRRISFPAGVALSGESSEITSYANVVRGVVKLSKVLEDGRQQLVGLQFAPDFLGRLFGVEQPAMAEAASDVELCRVPKSVLEALVKESPELKQRLLEQTLRELDEAREWMVTLGRKSAAERVASFLYLIAAHIDPEARNQADGHVRFDLPLSRSDIADFLGLTIETVSRQMTKLCQEGIIVLHNHRHVDVRDLNKLAARCG